MATAGLHLRSSANRASRDIRAASFGLLLVPIIIIVLLLGTLAAGVPADTAPGPYEGPAAVLDRGSADTRLGVSPALKVTLSIPG